MPYCLLCGSQNPYSYQNCSRCGIPHGRGYYDDIPDGFASCRIVEEFIEIADDTHERARFLAEVRTVQSVTYPFRSEDFVHEKWNEDRTWHQQSEDEKASLQILADVIRQNGWIDVIGANGTPTNTSLWRRIE